MSDFTRREGRWGHRTVGLTPVRLTDLDLKVRDSVLLRCPGTRDPSGNTACVWIGFTNKVTADSDEGTGGMPIAPGESATVPIEDARDLWLISTEEGQDVAYMFL